jgi:LPPG:FO 2-phospho-L-lactate transferase
MHVAALAGGVGAGKFLRGLIRVVAPKDVTAIVNTGDDIVLHGLHVSPDLDSVTYWLAGVSDTARGWGRTEETFRATEELRAFGAEGSWFALGDLDLATHLYRTRLLADGYTLSQATTAVGARFRIVTRILPMSDQRVTTRVEAVDEQGRLVDLHFQEYWVKRRGEDQVKRVRYVGDEIARPGPGVLEALAGADVILLCPSNPIASIGPILAVPGIAEAVSARRQRVVGVSPIVGGAPLRGMADRLLPAAGVEVSAAGVAGHYAGLIGGWVIDQVDVDQADRIEGTGVAVAVTDTIMVDDDAATALAEAAVRLAQQTER